MRFKDLLLSKRKGAAKRSPFQGVDKVKKRKGLTEFFASEGEK